jgi:pyrroloquinoline quinone (PQQ) biosynthesis protein C
MQQFSVALKDAVRAAWTNTLFKTQLWKDLNEKNFGVESYASYLRETFHYTRRSPLIQASAIGHFQTKYRSLARPFLKHALEEEGHYRLCALDLKHLGYDEKTLSESNPLPTTEGYIGFIFNRIAFCNPVSYLGYLYNLEYLAVEIGPGAADLIIKSTGLADSKYFSFLRVHSTEDKEHLEDLGEILAQIEERDYKDIIYTAVTAAALYSNMIAAAHQSPWSRP